MSVAQEATQPASSEPCPLPSTPRPVDIKRDRIAVIQGGTVIPLDQRLYVTDNPYCWLTLVPVDQPKGTYPCERHARLGTDFIVGTVDEIAEDYKQKLIRAFNQFACTYGDGVQHEIPTFGEASLDKQTAVIEKMGIKTGESTRLMQIDRGQYMEFEGRRIDIDGYEPQQDPFMRDLLSRLVATFLDRRFPDKERDRTETPTKAVKKVQKLIDALTVLRDDELGREAHWRKLKEQECTSQSKSSSASTPTSKEPSL